MGKKRKERREQIRPVKEKAVSRSNKKKKPDFWLTLFAIAVGIAMNWIPKTPPFLIGSLLLILILIGHPIWNLWWIEKKVWRRCCALFLAIIGLTIFGYYVWPTRAYKIDVSPSKIHLEHGTNTNVLNKVT